MKSKMCVSLIVILSSFWTGCSGKTWNPLPEQRETYITNAGLFSAIGIGFLLQENEPSPSEARKLKAYLETAISLVDQDVEATAEILKELANESFTGRQRVIVHTIIDVATRFAAANTKELDETEIFYNKLISASLKGAVRAVDAYLPG